MDLVSGLEVQLFPAVAKIIASVFSVLSTMHLFSSLYPDPASVSDGDCFDVIIVGAGSAGCVVANRFTEVEGLRVLLIEAGDDPQIDVLDDGYTGQLHKERRQHYAVGKMLGGSSGTNFMFYVRGHMHDYKNWENADATGWDWETVLYYFKKSEE